MTAGGGAGVESTSLVVGAFTSVVSVTGSAGGSAGAAAVATAAAVIERGFD